MSKLSVALCTYNGARYLQAQLESIANQTRPPDELVVTDDCSTDSTTAIIHEFAATAPFPVNSRVNDCNVGLTKNFERTISRCAGDIIALSDQDDVWLPQKLAKVEAALEQSPDVGLIFSDAELVDADLQPVGRRLWEFSFSPEDQRKFLQGRWLDTLMLADVVTGAAMAFRANFREFILPIPQLEASLHDGWIALVVGVFGKLAFIREPLLLYRQHSAQQLGVDMIRDVKPSLAARRRSDYQRIAHYYSLRIARLNALTTRLHELKKNVAIPANLEDQIRRLQDLITHYRVRGQLPSNRLHRLGPVVHELMARRYHRYSKGALSALGDLARDAGEKV